MNKRLQMLEGLIAGGSTDPFHHYARAMELRAQGDTEGALSAFDRVAERFPDYVPTFLMAAQCALELEQRQIGRDWLERGLEAARAADDEHALGELEAALKGLD